jgi:glycosyltransferase involved in cell wall biosynthesis
LAEQLDAILARAIQVKIAALAPFPFVGTEFGGGERIYNLLTRIEAPVDVLCPNYGDTFTDTHKNLTMHYVSVPEHLRQGEYDMVISKHSGELLKDKLQALAADVVILEHPWQVDALSGQKFVYDAHNNETALKQALSNQDSVEEASRVETLALQAHHVTYCSPDDVGATDGPRTYIANGTDIPQNLKAFGQGSKTLLFVGSAHPPNIGAAITLVKFAELLHDYQIVIAGECGSFIKTQAPNVSILGHVSKPILDYLFRTSHAFVNAMAAGSGTSLKVVKALSYGLPVIASEIGARGFSEACIIAKNAQELLDAVDRLQSPSHYESIRQASIKAAGEYTWDSLGKKFNEVVHSVL